MHKVTKWMFAAITGLLLIFPVAAFAAPVSWDFASNILQPLQSGWTALVKADHYQATGTIASIFPYASTTALSATTLCLSSDCRSIWPSGGTVTQVNTTYPIQGGPITTTGAISLAFGTSTSNTWGGTQTFTNNPILGILTGLISGNNGVLYTSATSSPTNGTGISLSGTGSVVGGSLSITNSGVTSVTAGTGISLSGSTGAVTITATGGSGSGNVATSSPETLGFLSKWTSTSATPATLANSLVYDTGTRIGIATTTPLSTLAVGGNMSIGTDYNIAAPTNGLIVEGNTGLGIMNPTFQLQVVRDGGAANIVMQSYGSVSPILGSYRARGSLASPTAVLADDALGGFGTIGYDGSGFSGFSANVKGRAAENWTTSAHGTYITFENVAVGSLTNAERVRYTPGGGIGVGSTTPWGYVGVNPTAGLFSNSFVVGSSTATLFLIDNSGKVGIGTTSPAKLFSLQGSALFSGDLSLANLTATGTITAANLVVSSSITSPLIIGGSGVGSILSLQSTSGVGSTDSIRFLVGNNGSTEAGRFTTSGSLGIGTTTPWATLAVNPIAGQASNQFVIGSSTATNFLLTNAGKVGIGTTSPSQVLSVNGKVYSATGGFQFPDGTVQTTASTGGGVSNVSTDATLTGGPCTTTCTLGFNLTNPNTWTGLQQFSNATSTLFTTTRNTYLATTGGSVGVGTTSPWGLLSVNANALAVGTPQFVVGSSTVTNFIISNAGNVGLNTTAPAQMLDIQTGALRFSFLSTPTTPTTVLAGAGAGNVPNGTYIYKVSFVNALGDSYASATSTPVTVTDNTTNGQITVTIPVSTDRSVTSRRLWRSANSSGAVGTWSSFAPGAQISSNNTSVTFTDNFAAPSGNQNTVVPTDAFDSGSIFGNANKALAVTGNGNVAFSNSVSVGSTSPFAYFSINPNALGSGVAAFSIGSSSLQDLIVTGAGYTGIGTTTPWGELSVNARLLPAGTPQFVVGSSTATNLVVANGGSVGVATTSPWRTLDVNGTVGMKGLTASSGLQTGVLCLSSNNEVINDSVACVASSKRFKNDIQPLTDLSGLGELMQLKPVSFKYKPEYNGALQNNPNYNGEQVGFIAEDVQKVDPRLVVLETQDSVNGSIVSHKGDVHSVRYEQMTAILVKAVQEQQKEIQSFTGGVKDSVQDKWQWIAIALLVCWNICLTFKRKY